MTDGQGRSDLAGRLQPQDVTIAIRPATPADGMFLRALYDEGAAPLFAPLGLPSAMLVVLLDQQFRAQQIGCATTFPQAEYLIVAWAGEPVGQLVVAVLPDATMHLVDVALADRARGQGIGTDVLSALIAAATAARARRVTLSVRQSNGGGRRLYERFGFTERSSSNHGPLVAMALDLG
jgi:ribosomal protein S18 acetylase RimI-like enzyme